MQVIIVILLIFSLCLPVCASEKDCISLSKDDIQRYLEKRWTPERIKMFCQPDTRQFVGTNGRLGSKSYSGQLYNDLENSLGKVTWRFKDLGDGTRAFEIDVNKGTDSWVVECAELGTNNFSESDFKKYLINEKLKYTFFAYQLLSEPGTKRDDIVSGFMIAAIESLQEKADGSMEASGVMFNNKKFKALVAKDFVIKAVLVNGKNNKYWDTAIKDVSKNVDYAFRSLSRCPMNSFGP